MTESTKQSQTEGSVHEQESLSPEVMELNSENIPEKIVVFTTTIEMQSDLDMPIQEYIKAMQGRFPDRKFYLMKWRGDVVLPPRGAIVDGEEIIYAKSGRVESKKHVVGNSERLLRNGGSEKNEQCLLIDVRRT